MKIHKMDANEFDALPVNEWDNLIDFDSLVLIPGSGTELHESGFRIIKCAAVRSGEAVCLLSVNSDVLDLDGAGGYGYRWEDKGIGVPEMVRPSGWSIECLPGSGYLHLFCRNKKMRSGAALSSLSIYSINEG